MTRVRELYEVTLANVVETLAWPAHSEQPTLCGPSPDRNEALLQGRATGTSFDAAGAVVDRLGGSTAVPWPTHIHLPMSGTTVITRHDHMSSGPLSAYHVTDDR